MRQRLLPGLAAMLLGSAFAAGACASSGGIDGTAAATGTAGTGATHASSASADTAAAAGGGLADLWPCAEKPFTPAPKKGWKHTRSSLAAAAGDPGHTAADAVVAILGEIHLTGKFTYGAISKDLEDEAVRAYLYGCDGWVAVGDARTDGDGRATVSTKIRPASGEYPFRMQVLGDGSVARGTLWVRPEGTRIAVFDVDGTLTTRDEELFGDLAGELLRHDYVPDAYPGGSALTKARAAGGELVVYLTGRPYLLTDMTRGWLEELGYARGPLFLASSSSEVLTTTSGVGDFKLRALKSFQKAGFVLSSAHGNALTDVYAYTKADIPKDAIWIIGEHGGVDGTRAVKDSWEPVLEELSTGD